MIQLSKRMQLLASMVTDGNRLADVGTDHGYIPIALILEKRIPSALAMDVNAGPLQRAGAHIREQGLDTYIETRLSDGLAGLKPGEADTVLIAGMGGALMKRILEGGSHCLDTVKELILQPQSEISLVREYLVTHGFCITEENIVLDEGKYYPMMKAVHGTGVRGNPEEYRYGELRLQRSPEILREYLLFEKKKTEKILDRLIRHGKNVSERRQILQEEEAVLNRMLEAVERYLPGKESRDEM